MWGLKRRNLVYFEDGSSTKLSGKSKRLILQLLVETPPLDRLLLSVHFM